MSDGLPSRPTRAWARAVRAGMRAQDSGRAAERVHERHAVSPTPNEPLRVAIVGTGFLASTRARCWRRVHGPAVEVVAAARDGAKAATFAREHGLRRGATIDAVLADPAVALADICVPNHAHRELCERAAVAGKHVLCTKPLAVFHGQGLPRD